MLAIIPARGGSKGVLKKNIQTLGGKPLIYWTIEAAMKAESISRVILSTDDKEIAELCKPTGIEIPFMRPIELAQDIAELLLADPPLAEKLTHLPAGYIIAEGRFRHSYTSAGPRYLQYRGGMTAAFRPGQAPAEVALARVQGDDKKSDEDRH